MKSALLAVGLAFATTAAVGSSVLAANVASDAARAEPAELSGAVLVRVKGMDCPMCAFGFKRRLKKLPGAEAVRLDYKAGTARITFKSGARINPDDIRKSVKDAGFEAIEIGPAIPAQIKGEKQ
ncbi:MAG: heavy-metal-associated domain-containing protein [Elusimicrobia bacterium]|nr:heavy-metal-associated domain-containing protein [Elusimicrobiota bacterium]